MQAFFLPPGAQCAIDTTGGVPETSKEKPALPESWSSILVDKGSPSKSLKLKLKKNPSDDISQLDGFEEVTKEAEVQTTERKPETKTKPCGSTGYCARAAPRDHHGAIQATSQS